MMQRVKDTCKKAVMILMIVMASFMPVRPAQASCDPFGAIATLAQVLLENAQTLILTALQQALVQLVQQLVQQAINTILGEVQNLLGNFLSIFQTQAQDELTMWQKMATQLSAAAIDQARQAGSQMDATAMSEAILTQQEEEVAAHRRYTPNDVGVCTAATVSGHLGRGDLISTSVATNLTREFIDRSLNARDPANPGDPIRNIGVGGAASDAKIRYDNYANIFCDAEFNRGYIPCAETIWENADISVGTWLTGRSTFLVNSPQERTAMKSWSWNLVEPAIDDPLPAAALVDSAGRKKMLARRSETARRAAAAGVINYIIGRRTEGSGAGQWIEELQRDAGIDMGNIDIGRTSLPAGSAFQPGQDGDDPSYYEALSALMKHRFFTPKSILTMTSKGPVETQKEHAVLKAHALMQLRDHYELLERVAMLLAIQTAMRAEQMETGTVKGEQAIAP